MTKSKSTILSLALLMLATSASAEEGFCNIRECGCPPYREPWCVLFIYWLSLSQQSYLYCTSHSTPSFFFNRCTPRNSFVFSPVCQKDFAITRVVKCGVVNQNQPPPRHLRQNSTCITLVTLLISIATRPITQILFTSPWDMSMASVPSNWSTVSTHTKSAKATATRTQNIARTICSTSLSSKWANPKQIRTYPTAAYMSCTRTRVQVRYMLMTCTYSTLTLCTIVYTRVPPVARRYF